MKKMEKQITQYLTERGWDNLRPVDVAKSIMIEGAELLELFQWHNATFDEVRADKKKVEEIKKELADILIYAFDMSVLLGLDTEKIMSDKIVAIKKKYPAALMRKNAKKDSGSGEDSEYLRIKKEYRRKGK